MGAKSRRTPAAFASLPARPLTRTHRRAAAFVQRPAPNISTAFLSRFDPYVRYNGGWMCDMCSAHLPPHTNAVLHCESALGRLRRAFVWFMVAIQVPFVDSTCAPRAKSVPPLLLPELRSIPPPPCISICTLISIRQAGAFANVVAPKLTSFLSF